MQAGDVDSVLTQFYERALASAARRRGAREDEIRRWVAEKLITPAGTRGMVYQGDCATAGLPNDVVAAHLVITALRLGHDVLTGDVSDIGHLAKVVGPTAPTVHAWP